MGNRSRKRWKDRDPSERERWVRHFSAHQRRIHPRRWERWDTWRGQAERQAQAWGWNSPWSKPKGWGLRRRLTVFFAVVALGAVGLTSWLTLGAAWNAQRQVAQLIIERSGVQVQVPLETPSDAGSGGMHWWWQNQDVRWNDPSFGPVRAAFGGLTRSALLAALLSFVLASVAAGLFTRRITRPLGALAVGARRLAAGERGLRLSVPSSNDELQGVTLAFNHLVEGLERQEAWRRGMVADIAHDLRTPLSVLRSEIEAMQDGVAQPDERGLDRLHAEVMLMARLVDDLRTLSLAEGGNLTLRLENTELAPFLSRTLESFSSRAAQGGVELKLEPIQPGLSATFDREQVMRVVQNLLENAVRHAGPGRVEVGARADGEFISLSVRDHGPGLRPEDFDRVFERFYQTDASRTRNTSGAKGSGLGLAIARAIAEAHGGRIAASNHPDGGAIFTVRLPVQPRVSPGKT
jgi:two-component system sensor histidine kinase BaeS